VTRHECDGDLREAEDHQGHEEAEGAARVCHQSLGVLSERPAVQSGAECQGRRYHRPDVEPDRLGYRGARDDRRALCDNQSQVDADSEEDTLPPPAPRDSHDANCQVL